MLMFEVISDYLVNNVNYFHTYLLINNNLLHSVRRGPQLLQKLEAESWDTTLW